MSADVDQPSGSGDLDAPADRTGPNRWVLVVAGLAVGVLVGAGLGWWSSRSDDGPAVPRLPEPSGPPETDEAAEAFLVAWERSRTSTYLSGSLLERTTGGGATMELPVVVAQRPPERVVSTGGSVEGTVDGRDLICDEQLDGMVHCQRAEDATDYREEVEEELAILESYFSGDLPIYRVAEEGDCFQLRLARAIQSPPYGREARFCFDPESGAPSLQRIVRSGSTDEVTLVSVRTEVTDEDLQQVVRGEIDELRLTG